MKSISDTERRIATAMDMRHEGKHEEALNLLIDLHDGHPNDPVVNLQCAWTHDKLGLGREAVPYYEAALEIGLDGEDLRSALLGLGSTYRALGDYEKAHSVLERGVELFPADRGILAFFAMALYNIGRAKPACEILLGVLTETTSDPSISQYEKAISLYAEDLDRTW